MEIEVVKGFDLDPVFKSSLVTESVMADKAFSFSIKIKNFHRRRRAFVKDTFFFFSIYIRKTSRLSFEYREFIYFPIFFCAS